MTTVPGADNCARCAGTTCPHRAQSRPPRPRAKRLGQPQHPHVERRQRHRADGVTHLQVDTGQFEVRGSTRPAAEIGASLAAPVAEFLRAGPR